MLGLMSGKPWENGIGQKRIWAKWGKSKACSFRFPWAISVVFGDKDAPYLWHRESTSHVRPASGEVGKSFLHLPFLKFLQLKIPNMSWCHIWRLYFLNPVNYNMGIPFYEYTAIYLLSIGFFLCFQFGAMINNANWIFLYMFFEWLKHSLILSIYLGVELLRHRAY